MNGSVGDFMEEKLRRGPVLGIVAALSAAAFFLRRQQLLTAYDETGMIRPGAGAGFFTYFTVAVVVLLALFAWRLRRCPVRQAISSRSLEAAVGMMLGAFGVLLGSGIMFFSPNAASDRLLALAGIFTAVCWAAVAVGNLQGKRLHPALFFLPVIFFGVRLARDFRTLSSDPVILDYCYALLALIFTMCALLELGAFAFDRGRRRLAVFFCLGSVFFNAASLADATPRNLALTGGALVYLLSYSWLLLRPVAVRKAAKDANP